MTNDIPLDIGDAIDQVRKDSTMILYRTTVHSKEASRAETDKISESFKGVLSKDYNLEDKANDITAAQVIGTFHWYDARPVFPDVKPADLPKQSDLKVLEIRKYDADTQTDNRAIFVLSTNQAEIEKTVEGIASFYTEKGYKLHQSWGGLKDCERTELDTKF